MKSPVSQNRSFKPGGITVLGFNRTGVSAGVVALVGIIGLTYVLTETGAQPLAAKAEAPAALVEFTPDDKLHPEHTSVATNLHRNVPCIESPQ